MRDAIIDDMARPHPQAATGTDWELISDRVMGGVSSGGLSREVVAGRAALRLQGDVRLDNNGGFVQAALDLAPGGGPVDARRWSGLVLEVFGNGETYNLHLRTDAIRRPWQSYRASFTAPPEWTVVTLPFGGFAPHRVDAPFDPGSLRRIGLVAIGRAFRADLALARLAFTQQAPPSP